MRWKHAYNHSNATCDCQVQMPSVSIVLPVLISHPWQRHLTDAAIKILRDTTQVPFELVVVETESQDFIPQNGEWVYRRVETRRGLAEGINAGLGAASGDFIGWAGR